MVPCNSSCSVFLYPYTEQNAGHTPRCLQSQVEVGGSSGKAKHPVLSTVTWQVNQRIRIHPSACSDGPSVGIMLRTEYRRLGTASHSEQLPISFSSAFYNFYNNSELNGSRYSKTPGCPIYTNNDRLQGWAPGAVRSMLTVPMGLQSKYFREANTFATDLTSKSVSSSWKTWPKKLLLKLQTLVFYYSRCLAILQSNL